MFIHDCINDAVFLGKFGVANIGLVRARTRVSFKFFVLRKATIGRAGNVFFRVGYRLISLSCVFFNKDWANCSFGCQVREHTTFSG